MYSFMSIIVAVFPILIIPMRAVYLQYLRGYPSLKYAQKGVQLSVFCVLLDKNLLQKSVYKTIPLSFNTVSLRRFKYLSTTAL